MRVTKWEIAIERGTEDCVPELPWEASQCVVCGKVVQPISRGIHPTGSVMVTVKFETPDELPRIVNLRMFDNRLPDLDARIVRHTWSHGTQRAVAEFYGRQEQFAPTDQVE